jgi:hypothetical protein
LKWCDSHCSSPEVYFVSCKIITKEQQYHILMHISSKKYHLLVQSIEFSAGISQNNRSIMVLSNSPKLTLCLSSSNDMDVGTKSDSKCKLNS